MCDSTNSKICRTCEQDLPLSEYYSRPTLKGVWYWKDCKQCSIKKQLTKYYNDTESFKKYQRERERRVRAAKYGVIENFTQQDEDLVMDAFGHKCFRCGATEDLQVDHHQPLHLGNPLTLKNAVVLCKSCNRTGNGGKGRQLPEDFYTEAELKTIEDIMNSYTKTCTQCGETKPITDYHKAYRRKDGSQAYHAACKVCKSNYGKKWYAENRSKILERYHSDPEGMAIYMKHRYAADPEKYRAYSREYYAKNREAILAKQKARRSKAKQGGDQ